jgi:uncharacterized protein (TIGR02646 family)
MIKIEKDIESVPQSLIPAFSDLFPDLESIPKKSKTTHQKRMDIITIGTYNDSYSDRYKTKDIRNALEDIYKGKCGFCEQEIEQYEIEHYRPKKTYHWIAFSWDNLIVACQKCNGKKGIHFELNGNKVEFENTEINIRNINCSSSAYDVQEQPKMVNPEITNPLGLIEFTRDGKIISNHDRFSYTIEKCGIDRKDLNDKRRKLLDVFERDVRSELNNCKNELDQQTVISSIIRKFVRDSKDCELPFLAFRRFAITSGMLNEIIKEMN